MSCGSFTEVQYILEQVLPRNMNNKRVLDVGCGYGFYGWALKAYGRTGEAKGFTGSPYIVGVDVNELRSLHTKKHGLYDEVYVMDITKQIPEGHYDIVILSHVLEHIQKNLAYTLLKNLEDVSGMIVIVTPYGDATDLLVLDKDSHVSSWTEKDLDPLGYKTRHIRFSHRAGRVVSWFEAFYFKVKGLKHGGVLVAWKC